MQSILKALQTTFEIQNGYSSSLLSEFALDNTHNELIPLIRALNHDGNIFRYIDKEVLQGILTAPMHTHHENLICFWVESCMTNPSMEHHPTLDALMIMVIKAHLKSAKNDRQRIAWTASEIVSL